jgi:hypothetical protein
MKLFDLSKKHSGKSGAKGFVPLIKTMGPLVFPALLTLGLIIPLGNHTQAGEVRNHDMKMKALHAVLIPDVHPQIRQGDALLARNDKGGRNRKKDRQTGNSSRSQKKLSPEEKTRLNQQLEQWKNLPPEKQDELRRRMETWQSLPPEEKDIYKKRYKQWKKLSPEEQRVIRQKLERWDSLPQGEREQILRKFKE